MVPEEGDEIAPLGGEEEVKKGRGRGKAKPDGGSRREGDVLKTFQFQNPDGEGKRRGRKGKREEGRGKRKRTTFHGVRGDEDLNPEKDGGRPRKRSKKRR